MADILIVEDKESLRTMLRTTLESRGYAVDEAGDAYEARKRLQAFRYLVVLTDLKLPAGSGLDVLRAAREADADTPVVVMTAFGTVEEAVQAMKLGAADFLTKPLDDHRLTSLLESIVEDLERGRAAAGMESSSEANGLGGLASSMCIVTGA